MDSTAILSDLKRDMSAEDHRSVKPLPADRWLASSSLQKSIRRGDTKSAERAALTLWMQDKRSFWRRIAPAISLEDIGVSSPGVIVKTLTAFNAPAWRAKNDDLRVGLHLVRLMCAATKIRLADEIYAIASSALEYRDYREEMAKANDQTLADIILHDKTPLPKKAIALWLLAGTRRYPHDNMPERTGSLEVAAEVLLALGAPADLTNACIDTLNKSQWPLALWAPLLWTEVHKQPQPPLVLFDKFTSSPTVNGIPLCALDGFTRVGKACFSQLKKAVPELKPFTARQIHLGMFYSEGCCVDRRLGSERLEEYRQAGEFADAEGAAMDAAHYLGLKDILARHVDTLEGIRRKQLQAYLNRPQGELAFGGAE